jgi:hypothetical protein
LDSLANSLTPENTVLLFGEAQKFVVQAPKAELSAGGNSQVTVKLIPANRARTLQNSAIEILGAQVVN